MADIMRGGVYWADLGRPSAREQGGRRPVLVLSHDVFSDRSGTVIALAISSQPQRAGYPLTWRLPEGMLPRTSWVKISQVRTLSADRLGSRLGEVGERETDELVRGLLQLVA